MAEPQPSAPPVEVDQMARLQAILDQYEISIAEANDLVLLQDYEIIFIADDSGSMNTCSVPPHERRLGVRMPTRWDELKETILQVIDIACCFDEDGVDVYFLNRPAVKNITSRDDPNLLEALAPKPSGRTPLSDVLCKVIAEHSTSERPVLCVVATDGEPDDGPLVFMSVIALVLREERTKFRFQVLACTDDEESIGWLNAFDAKFDEVDVTDDYYSERKEVLAAGKCKQFKRSDWVIKALLGPISTKFDQWDEPATPPVKPAQQQRAAPPQQQQQQQQQQRAASPASPASSSTVVVVQQTNISVTAPRKEYVGHRGYLEKFSCGNKMSLVKNWKKRFCVHTRDSFDYFKEMGDSKPQGSFPYQSTRLLHTVSESTHPEAVSNGRYHYFALANGSRVLLLRTHSKEEKEAWCRSLSKWLDN